MRTRYSVKKEKKEKGKKGGVEGLVGDGTGTHGSAADLHLVRSSNTYHSTNPAPLPTACFSMLHMHHAMQPLQHLIRDLATMCAYRPYLVVDDKT